MRSLKTYLKAKKMKSLRNLYIQMDNASPNKNFCVIAAMGALVLLGIVKKVKISYLMTGHSHTFNDGVVGTVGNRFVEGDVPTFEKFREVVNEAFADMGSKNHEVYRIVGMTDYKEMFCDIRANPHDIEGETNVIYVIVNGILKV